MPESTFDKPGRNPNTNISTLRLAIDEIDAHILDLINRRLLLAQQIGHVKQQDGIQISDQRREKDIMDRLLRTNSGPLDANSLQHIFTAIIAAGRSVQKGIKDQND
jgi:chorismate mutase/prephenate dehydratase